MDLGLKDKVIVVTGGASGIGEAITRACIAEGARVVVLSRISAGVEQFMAEMHNRDMPCELVALELESHEGCRSAVDHVVQRYGRIDGLVNNAGVNDGVGLETGDVERFEGSLRQNLVHCYALAHFALPSLKLTRGSIVNISSKVALTGQGNTSGYAAAKGAVLGLTREWAVELLPYGIRVNAVIPSEVMTPAYDTWLASLPSGAGKLESIKAQIPLDKRMTKTAEIAAAVVFLLSPVQSAHTTGQQLVVDGGYVHLDRMVTAAK